MAEIKEVLLTSVHPSPDTWDKDEPDWIDEGMKITDPIICIGMMDWKGRVGMQIHFREDGTTGTYWHFVQMPITIIYH